jgi:crotonobetainyl-CoA:carnitine CoA-transferase CaiB-like acyl-CoA transferase
MKDILTGVRIVDVTTIVMGPMASQILGDMGAEVIKVETLNGDLARHSGTPGPDGMGALFANNNRNKKSIALDLGDQKGKAVMRRLIKSCDVVLHNMRPQAAAKLGLSADDVRSLNPAVVHCAAVGFGSGGPYAGRAAYDDVIQAVSGLAGLPLSLGRDPAYVPSIAADKVAALHVVYAILAALIRRMRTGKGCSVEVPMFEALAAFLLNEHLDAASFEALGEPGYVRLLNPNRRPYQTKDGWLAVMPYSEAHWRRVLEEFGREDVAAEPWFASASGRNTRSETLYGVLLQSLPERTSDTWMKVFRELDIPHAPVNTLHDLLEDPHLEAVGFFTPNDGCEGRVRSIPQPVRFADIKECPDRAAPAIGADTEQVLEDLGYTLEEVDDLRAAGVVRA